VVGVDVSPPAPRLATSSLLAERWTRPPTRLARPRDRDLQALAGELVRGRAARQARADYDRRCRSLRPLDFSAAATGIPAAACRAGAPSPATNRRLRRVTRVTQPRQRGNVACRSRQTEAAGEQLPASQADDSWALMACACAASARALSAGDEEYRPTGA